MPIPRHSAIFYLKPSVPFLYISCPNNPASIFIGISFGMTNMCVTKNPKTHAIVKKVSSLMQKYFYFMLNTN